MTNIWISQSNDIKNSQINNSTRGLKEKTTNHFNGGLAFDFRIDLGDDWHLFDPSSPDCIYFDEDEWEPHQADKDVIYSFLKAIFNSNNYSNKQDALIEIALSDGTPEQAIKAARLFSLDKLREAADYAAVMNNTGRNAYFGPALRAPNSPIQKRASKANIIGGDKIWIDADTKLQVERTLQFLKDNNIEPLITVTTGTIPEHRMQFILQLDRFVDPQRLEVLNDILIKQTNTDDVGNADRIMRLGGSINYPSHKKLHRRYVRERTTIDINEYPTIISVDHILRLNNSSAASLDNPFNQEPSRNSSLSTDQILFDVATGVGLSDFEIKKLLEATKQAGQWHNNMLRVTASLAAKGYTESEIRKICGPYCKDGEADNDLTPMIKGAMRKRNQDWKANSSGTFGAFNDLQSTIDNQLIPTDQSIEFTDFTFEAWQNKLIPERDFLLGQFLATTSRIMLYGETGVGKTLLALEMAAAVAAGEGFLHWAGSNTKRKVLYIDGELPSETVKSRVLELSKRFSLTDELIILSRDALPDNAMPPLNTALGQQWLMHIIDKLKPALIVFDNIMSLLIGDMKDEQTWEPVKPLIRLLTKKKIGQLWLHHTGHDTSKSYGSKTREWELDTVVGLTIANKEEGTINFTISKARSRSPSNANNYRDMKLRLSEEGWIWETVSQSTTKKPKSDRAILAAAIMDTYHRLADDFGEAGLGFNNRPVRKVAIDRLRKDLIDRGHLEASGPEGGLSSNQRSLFNRAKSELLNAQKLVQSGDYVWSP